MTGAYRPDLGELPDNDDTEPRLAPAPGSASGVPDALRTRIKDLIRDAWKHGFDADGPDAIGFIDEFALADEALDEYWPNEQAEASGARGRPIANPDAPAALPPARS